VAPLLVGDRGLLLALGAAGRDRCDRPDDEEEDACCDRHELDHGGDEGSVEELRVVDREGEVAEVGLPEDGTDHRCDDVGDERVQQGGEGDAHHERDRQFDQVSPCEEILELLEHEALLPVVRASAVCGRGS
jgi:hypothetical protein